jgi:hypothetical protein
MKSVITFLSQLALVSLAISFETVAAHPRHRHNERAHHHGQPQPRPVATTTTTVPNVPFATRGIPSPAPAPATISNSVGNITSRTPPPPATGGSGAYQLVTSYSGSSFFNNFNFFTGADPTHGFVK